MPSGLWRCRQNRLLLLRDAFHGCDQVRNQVGAALQHDVHLRPGGLHRLILGHQSVADADILSEGYEGNQCQNRDHD